MNKILLTISIFFFLSCNKNLEKKDCSSDQKTDKKFEMYQKFQINERKSIQDQGIHLWKNG